MSTRPILLLSASRTGAMAAAKSGKKIAILSGVIVLLVLLLGGVGAFLILRGPDRVSNHLQAGNLNLKLERVGFTASELDEKGYLRDVTYESEKVYHHYSSRDKEDVFMTSSPVALVPGAFREAELRLSHESYDAKENLTEAQYKEKYGENSSSAFGYWMELRLDASKNTNWKDLAEQLTVTVCRSEDDGATYGDPIAMKVFPSGDSPSGAALHLRETGGQTAILIGDAQNPVGTLGVGDAQRFKVRISFDNLGAEYDPAAGTVSSANDKAKGQEVWFDLVVFASLAS